VRMMSRIDRGQEYRYYWQRVIGDEKLRLDLEELKDAASKYFKNVSDNYKQRLVYQLLEAVKNKDQGEFFYILLKTINKPKEGSHYFSHILQKNYDTMPDEIFINFAYSIILGIMSTYSPKEDEKGGNKNE